MTLPAFSKTTSRIVLNNSHLVFRPGDHRKMEYLNQLHLGWKIKFTSNSLKFVEAKRRRKMYNRKFLLKSKMMLNKLTIN